jgi:DNA repair protein RecO (recombination protein O)
MKTYDDRAIVLSGFRLGEADKIVTLLTPARGKVKAVAKGLRKAKSRFGGRLEALNHIDVTLYQGKSLYTVTGVSVVHAFPRMRSSFERTNIGLACAEAASKAVHEGQPATAQYECLLEALLALERGWPGPWFFAGFLFRLSRSAGFEFRLGSCVKCGRIGSRFRYLSYSEGGVVCSGCSERVRCANVGEDVIESLRQASERTMFELLLDSVSEERRNWGLRDPRSSSETPARLQWASTVTSATHAMARLFEYHLEDRLRSVESGLCFAGRLGEPVSTG